MKLHATLILVLFAFFSSAILETAEARRGPRPKQANPEMRAQRAEIQAQKGEIQAFIQEFFPERAQRIASLRKRAPEIYRERRQRIVREAKHLMKMRQEDPALFLIHVDEIRSRYRVQELAKAWKEASADDRPAIEKTLRETLNRVFDLRQETKAADLDRLLKRVEELRTSLEDRLEDREKLIEERLEKLTSEGQEDW